VEHCISAGARAIVCNSHYLQRKLKANFPQWVHKKLTMYNGIEFERFTDGQPIPMIIPSVRVARLLAAMTCDHEQRSAGARLLSDAMRPITEKIP
jgi:hypothetical protein